MSTTRHKPFLAALCFTGLLFAAAGCGGGSSSDQPNGQPSQALRAAALSLQQAMNSTSRQIDDMSSNRESLDRLGSTLQPAISQTSDVIGLLTTKATSAGPEAALLKGAREQRSFLQFASTAPNSRSRRSANSALARTRTAGRQSTSAYAAVAQTQPEIAGLLPAATTFNTGRLRDAVLKVTRRSTPKTTTTTPPASTPSGGGASGSAATGVSCDDGLSVNSVTSCPFARAVRDEYQSSGGASAIEVFSPVTHRSYTMTCTGAVPTTCRGGNGALVAIR
jgi:hypothetical protein